jgi:pimeloyl-ACP methyl ester carboxylesterase
VGTRPEPPGAVGTVRPNDGIIGARAYRAKFTGAYGHRVIDGGVGHNLPQEAPEGFAEAIIDVDGFGPEASTDAPGR